MRSSEPGVALFALVGLLLIVVYPALFLDQRLAPQASLKSEPPWRVQLGPYPNPSPVALRAATHLGPRLASIARDGLDVALWNPSFGGGRPGWLSSPEEGGAPPVVAAGLLARPGWRWTALLALQLSAAFLAMFWVLHGLGTPGWPAAVGATAYALSGPVSGLWLDWQGAALALGPLALVPVLFPPRLLRHRVAAWAAVMALLASCGPPAAPFFALALALLIASRPILGRPARLGAPLLAGAVAAALLVPALWLDRSGGEPGAPGAVATPSQAPVTPSAFVVPPPAPETMTGTADPADERTPAYLGGGTLILAALGAWALSFRARGFWLGVLLVTLASALAPSPLLARAGLSQRALGVLALAAAVLAAHGTRALCLRLPSPGVRGAAGLAIWAIVVLALMPPAAARLPFAAGEEAELAAPVPADLKRSPSRLVGLLGMLPPDVSGALGLADVRASSFRREPRYASLLGADREGELSVSRALDPRTARLFARWLLEPLPLRVVSGEIFARVDPSELEPVDEHHLDGLRRFRAELPSWTCRVGFRAGLPLTGVWLERPGRRTQLERDAALAAESDEWQWYAVPERWPPGEAMVAVAAREWSPSGRLTAAWDASGLRVAHEERGVRVWSWDLARPPAFLATGVRADAGPLPADPTVVTVEPGRLQALSMLADGGAGGRVRIAGAAPSRVELHAETARPALLITQIKFRPSLWRAEVNGRAVACDRADGVWTAVPLPAGRSTVELRARLPLAVWLTASAGLLALIVLSTPRRKR